MGTGTTGADIVADMAKGRPWWRLRPADVQPWLDCLPSAVAEEKSSGIAQIGRAWNGVSDVALGDHIASANWIASLLGGLRERLLGLDPVVAAPGTDDVRFCEHGYGRRLALVVDFDLGDLVVPLCVEGWTLRNAGDRWQDAAQAMVDAMRLAVANRERLARREGRMRQAFVKTVEGIGHGAAPLWFRMDPLRVGEDAANLIGQSYGHCLLVLDNALDWVPTGSDRGWNMADIRAIRGHHALYHRRRAGVAATLERTGAQAMFSDVALAIASERGLDPASVAAEALALRRSSETAGVEIEDTRTPTTLHMIDGTVQAMFRFEGGNYYAGSLTIWGDFPQTLAAAALGRPLTDFVDHPAFRATGVKVARAVQRQGALDLHHRVRIVPVGGPSAATDLSDAAATTPRLAA